MTAFVTADIGPEHIKNADMLRFYEAWETARGNVDMPMLAAMPVGEIWCHDNLMLIASEADDYRYVHYGAAIAHSSGFDMSGRLISEFESKTGRFFRDCYERCMHERVPLYTVHRAAHATLVTEWERLLVPLCDAHGGVTHVLAYNRPLGYQHELLGQVLSALSDIVIGVQRVSAPDLPANAAGFTIAVLNQAAEQFFEVNAVDTVGMSLEAGLPDWNALGLQSALAHCASGLKPVEQVWKDPRGAPQQQFRVKLTPYEGGVVMTMSDITSLVNKTAELEQLNSDLVQIANTDALTQAQSRRHFLEHCGQETARSARYEYDVSVVYMDIDYFKRINDEYGHAVGDQVLIEVTSLTRSMIRDCDSFGRLGGEEFAILLPHTELAAAVELAARIRDRIASTLFRIQKQSFNVTCSFGVAQHEPGASVDALLATADAALYEAKKTGRNRVRKAAGS